MSPDRRPPPMVAIEREQLEALERRVPPWGLTWWQWAFAAAVIASALIVLGLDYFGRLK